ncbi:FAD:protein FMN transferase [Bacterioplanoides sp.]|uniref:FAD:protein FMN transferase n=1 Tax=Bacterioplanoides sp. TaxID=2066072 RepID=UPI003B00A2B3
MVQILFAVLLIGTLNACTPGSADPIQKISGPTMGTLYHISWLGSEDRVSVKNQVDQRLAEINKVMSTYDPASELSLINQLTKWPIEQSVSAELANVLQLSLDVYQKSDGAFDITVGPLVNLWGFGPQGDPEKVPDKAQIQAGLSRVGSDAISLSDQQLTITQARYLDLSAIAKGWAVDDIARLLETQGITNYLVEIGGEIRTSGQKADATPWRIAIERPDVGLQQTAHRVFSPQGRALATSGDYRNFFIKDGVRYSHTISPKTGYPVAHELASVTVVNNSAALADAWATALNVAGPERGMQLADSLDLAVYMIVRDENDQLNELTSTTFNLWFPDFLPEASTENE